MSNNILSNEQIYNASEDSSVSAGVHSVICILVPRGLVAAGFSADRKLLTIHFTGCKKSKPVWDINFFEQLFSAEPLLSDKHKVKGVFLLNDKELVVPDNLYDPATAETWLGKIHFVERTDVVSHYPVAGIAAQYLQSMPLPVTELLRINFPAARVLPLAYYQLANPGTGCVLQCFIGSGDVAASLFHESRLLWHRVFQFGNADDIAYNLLQAVDANNLERSRVTFYCNLLTAAEFNLTTTLSQYFPGIVTGSGAEHNGPWQGAISLAMQLFSCV